MDYFEVEICFNPELPDLEEILIAELSEFLFESFVSSEDGNGCLKAYIQESTVTQQKLEKYVRQIQQKYTSFNFSINLIKDENWNAKWESEFEPVIISDKCRIRATFHEENKNIPYEITIDPKMAFGTGHHETTSLVIEQMLKLDFTEKTVCDMGCGTGILAILAAKLNATKVLAIDNDEWAYNNAIENIELNNCAENIMVKQGSIDQLPENALFDYFIANINRNILLENLMVYVKHTKTGGHIILSGIYESDISVIDQLAKQHGLQFKNMFERNKWVSLLYNK